MGSPARPKNNTEAANDALKQEIAKIANSASTWEEGMAEFESFAQQAIADKTLYEALPQQYQGAWVVHKPLTYGSLKSKFETLLKKALDDKRSAADRRAMLGDDEQPWRKIWMEAVREKDAIVKAIQSGNGSYADARVDNVKALLEQATTELDKLYFDMRSSEGFTVKEWKPGTDKQKKDDYKSCLALIQATAKSLDSEIDAALRGRGVTGRRDVYGEDGSIIGQTNIVEGENAGYKRPADVLYKGGYLTRGMTEDTAKQMLKQASQSTEAGGYTYVTYVSQCAAILASDRFKSSGIELYGLSSDVVWQCARSVLKAANEILDEYQGKHVGGNGFFGNAKMASSDKEFSDNLAALKVSVNDLSRPMGKDEDIFSNRAIDPQNFGASMYLAGNMFYSKLSVGARMFGNMDYSMRAGDHPTVLLNWRRMSPDAIRDAEKKRQYGELKQSVEYYQNIYDNLRTMLTSLYDQGNLNAGYALSVYYNSYPSWEKPVTIKKWEGLRTTTTQEIIDKAKAEGSAVSGAGGTEAVVQQGGDVASADGENPFGEGTLGRYWFGNYPMPTGGAYG